MDSGIHYIHNIANCKRLDGISKCQQKTRGADVYLDSSTGVRRLNQCPTGLDSCRGNHCIILTSRNSVMGLIYIYIYIQQAVAWHRPFSLDDLSPLPPLPFTYDYLPNKQERKYENLEDSMSNSATVYHSEESGPCEDGRHCAIRVNWTLLDAN